MSDLQVEYIQELQNRIAQLEAELRGVREAAEPFVSRFKLVEPRTSNPHELICMSIGYFRDLAQALESTGAPEGQTEDARKISAFNLMLTADNPIVRALANRYLEGAENLGEFMKFLRALPDSDTERREGKDMSEPQQTQQMIGNLEHYTNCPERNPRSEEFCTCGLIYRKYLQTEQAMHAAWRKRAEEAESQLDLLRNALRRAEQRELEALAEIDELRGAQSDTEQSKEQK